MVKRIVLFASGSGTNAENIIKYFKNNHQVEVINVFTNNPKAGVIELVRPFKIPVNIFDKVQLNSGLLCKQIKALNPDLIVLAGFLLKIPLVFINTFTRKIVNIHPSLLPNHGGKGMYGMNVHNEVIKNKEDQSGISIHYVNKQYDEGEIIFQKSTKIIYPCTAKKLAKKIHELEMKYFPEIIEKLINSECYE